MHTRGTPSKFQIVIFTIGFVLLFFLVFALGVIVGKGLKDTDHVETKVVEESETEIVGGPDGATIDEELLQTTKAEVKKDIDNEEIAKEDLNELKKNEPLEPKIDEKKSQEPASKSEKSADKPSETVKKEIKENKDAKYTAKLDYSVPDFPKTDPGGKFTVQLGSFRSVDNAYSLEKKLNARGYPSFVKKFVVPNKGTWYRVRVGTFNNKEKAKIYAEKIKSKEKLAFSQVTINN